MTTKNRYRIVAAFFIAISVALLIISSVKNDHAQCERLGGRHFHTDSGSVCISADAIIDVESD